MIKDDKIFSINEIFLGSGNYCFNKCKDIDNELSYFKKCLQDCQTFQNKKFEYIENYLYQMNGIIEGNKIPIREKEKIINIQDKYILPEHFYRSSELENIPEPKSGVGAMFGQK